MYTKYLGGLWPSWIVSVIVLAVMTGCAGIPSTYRMTPEQTKAFRSDLGTIGVAVSEYRAELEFTRPAKGRFGGLKRGFVSGAVKPILLGFVAPVPGGTFVGILVSPFTAIAGAGYGVLNTPPRDEIEKAEAGINQALDKLRSQNLRKAALKDFVQLAEQRSSYTFVPLPGRGPKQRDEEIRYDELDLNGIDTVLELRVTKGGLWGSYEIVPPSAAYLETRVRVIRASDNEVLLEDTVRCVGEQRKYLEWGENNGQLFYDNALACLPRLQEKIIDDLFLVYPLATP
ncbi:MAG: hypothetical protein ABFS45_06010 [Pseudomonadota bacterium]